MDDQFGGRTDDDLFYDDFEPVDSQGQPATATASAPVPAPITGPTPEADPTPVAQAPTEPAKPPPATAAKASSSRTLPPAKNLSHSRFADKPAVAAEPVPSPTPSAPKEPEPAATVTASTPSPAPAPAPAGPSPPPNAPTGPKEKTQPQRSSNTADPTARLGSGANPRQKLTEVELAAKMEKMKLVSAEKTRRFEMAEKDEKQHAAAYEKGMEDARKRRVEDAAKRRRGEEERRRMDDERAKNRERKLKAMGTKEGGWDEGKEALEEEESRRAFRGANGGVRGARSAGLGASRYARDGEEHDVDRFLDERHRNNGRGRGRGGRGGRGGYDRDGAQNSSPAASKQQRQDVPKGEDFPALPAGKKLDSTPAKGNETTSPAPLPVEPLLSPPIGGGKWDDEMEALDALREGKS